jgi:nucleoside 2-deoxyribosyltransferase
MPSNRRRSGLEPREQTAQAIFAMDVAAIDRAAMVVGCMDGRDPDRGTAWEWGYAYANRTPIQAA